MIINYMEKVVEEYLDKILSDPIYDSVCKCEQCRDDIMAKALNKLQPFYITTKTGEVFAEYSKLEIQNQAELIKEVINAIQFVSAKPNHKRYGDTPL